MRCLNSRSESGKKGQIPPVSTSLGSQWIGRCSFTSGRKLSFAECTNSKANFVQKHHQRCTQKSCLIRALWPAKLTCKISHYKHPSRILLWDDMVSLRQLVCLASMESCTLKHKWQQNTLILPAGFNESQVCSKQKAWEYAKSKNHPHTGIITIQYTPSHPAPDCVHHFDLCLFLTDIWSVSFLVCAD